MLAVDLLEAHRPKRSDKVTNRIPGAGGSRRISTCPRCSPKASGGKESPYCSILDRLQADSSHCPYAFGVHFTYNIELSHKNNFFEKLGSLKKTLSVWSRRDLSIYGRINIVKTLALSKLVFISSVMETPKSFATEVNKIVFDFILKQKPAKIKKTTLIKKKSDGGLGVKDFVLFDKTLKLTWVKRLCSESDAPWKYIPKSFLYIVGGTEIFQCNYDYNSLDLMAIFLNLTNKLFIIGKKSCLRHLTARPRYCLRQSGTTNSLRLTKKWYINLIGTEQV